jgi:hypothetical protein
MIYPLAVREELPRMIELCVECKYGLVFYRGSRERDQKGSPYCYKCGAQVPGQLYMRCDT